MKRIKIYLIIKLIKLILMSHSDKPSLIQSVGTAGLAAIITVNFVHPIDTIKTRLQIDGEAGRSTAKYTGSLSAIKIIMKEGGISAFYKGI